MYYLPYKSEELEEICVLFSPLYLLYMKVLRKMLNTAAIDH